MNSTEEIIKKSVQSFENASRHKRRLIMSKLVGEEKDLVAMKEADRQETRSENFTLVSSLIIIAIGSILLGLNLCQTYGEGVLNMIAIQANFLLFVFEIGHIFLNVDFKLAPENRKRLFGGIFVFSLIGIGLIVIL